MKAAILAAIGALFLSVVNLNADTITFEWDPAPPEDGPITYAVERRADDSAPTEWVQITTTSNLTITMTMQPGVRNLYRLKLTNENGQSVYDPAIYADRPAGSSGFRVKDTSSASVSGEVGAMLAAFEAAIAAPDPETPSHDLFEAFLALQALGETPFAPPAPERPENKLAVLTQG